MTRTSSTRDAPQPLVRTPEPDYVEGAWFDEEAVDRVVRFFRHLRHIKGRRWAGRPVELDPWQIEHFVRPVFGWKHPDGRRIVSTVWLELPRKNGKTTLGTGTGLYLLSADGEPGAEVYAAAGGRDQARFVFDPARQMVENSPSLSKRLDPLRNSIVYRAQGSFFQVVSSVARLQHGGNVHGAVIDEVHVHRTRELIDALETGTGSRDQPLILFITTAGDLDEGSIYSEKHSYCRQVASGNITDPSFFGAIFAAADPGEDYDWRDEAAWGRANPGIDVTVRRDYLEKKARAAEASPQALQTFLRFHLGVRSRGRPAWIALDRWDASKGKPKASKLRGKACYGAIDLGRTDDIAALAWDFPRGERHEILWRFFVPEAALRSLDERTGGQASKWIDDGKLFATPGDIVDYEAIRRQVLHDADSYEVQEVAYHRRGMTQLALDLQDEGLTVVPVGQGIASLAAASQELERLVFTKRYHHGGHPVARWMVDSTAPKTDREGNAMPDRSASRDVITGVMASVMALDRTMRHESEENEPVAFVVDPQAGA